MYLSLHCHHQNDSCIKIGSDESDFNVSLTLRTKSQDSFHNCTTTFLKREESRSGFEPRSLCLLALPLGQAGCHDSLQTSHDSIPQLILTARPMLPAA